MVYQISPWFATPMRPDAFPPRPAPPRRGGRARAQTTLLTPPEATFGHPPADFRTPRSGPLNP